MNYAAHYKRLVDRAPKKKPKGVYLECHRIIPGCMGGKYVTENIAYLTPEEHYIAHQLLVKIYPEKIKLVWAANMMTRGSLGNRINNKKHGWIRRRLSNLRKGVKLSPEICKKISESRKGIKISDEGRASISRARIGNKNALGYKHSIETRKKVSLSHTGLKRTDLTRAKMSAAAKGNKNPLGVKRSEETKLKMKNSALRRWHGSEAIL